MFDHLFGSKTRVKLLNLFLNHPDQSFYVREITRKVDEQINSVRRELQNLLNIGIVKSAEENNRLYYEINQRYEFYNELQAIFRRLPSKSKVVKTSDTEESKLADKLRKTGTVKLAFLTGAFVNAQTGRVDIFIVGDVNRVQVTKLVASLEKDMGRELNYTILTPDEFEYRMTLHDRFLSDILRDKKTVLIDAEAETKSDESRALAPEPGAKAIPIKLEAQEGVE